MKKHHTKSNKLSRIAAMGVMLVLNAGCGQSIFKSARKIDPASEATVALEKQNPDGAISILNNALAGNPGNPSDCLRAACGSGSPSSCHQYRDKNQLDCRPSVGKWQLIPIHRNVQPTAGSHDSGHHRHRPCNLHSKRPNSVSRQTTRRPLQDCHLHDRITGLSRKKTR